MHNSCYCYCCLSQNIRIAISRKQKELPEIRCCQNLKICIWSEQPKWFPTHFSSITWMHAPLHSPFDIVPLTPPLMWPRHGFLGKLAWVPILWWPPIVCSPLSNIFTFYPQLIMLGGNTGLCHFYSFKLYFYLWPMTKNIGGNTSSGPMSLSESLFVQERATRAAESFTGATWQSFILQKVSQQCCLIINHINHINV